MESTGDAHATSVPQARSTLGVAQIVNAKGIFTNAYLECMGVVIASKSLGGELERQHIYCTAGFRNQSTYLRSALTSSSSNLGRPCYIKSSAE